MAWQMIGQAVGKGLEGWMDAREGQRQQRNEWARKVAEDQYMDPNRTLNEALRQNVRGNFLANLGLQGEGGNPYEAFMQSVRGGINPQLLAEYQNMARIPGLSFGGQMVGQDPLSMYKPEKRGFLESLGLGAAKVLGQGPMGMMGGGGGG